MWEGSIRVQPHCLQSEYNGVTENKTWSGRQRREKRERRASHKKHTVTFLLNKVIILAPKTNKEHLVTINNHTSYPSVLNLGDSFFRLQRDQ